MGGSLSLSLIIITRADDAAADDHDGMVTAVPRLTAVIAAGAHRGVLHTRRPKRGLLRNLYLRYRSPRIARGRDSEVCSCSSVTSGS